MGWKRSISKLFGGDSKFSSNIGAVGYASMKEMETVTSAIGDLRKGKFTTQEQKAALDRLQSRIDHAVAAGVVPSVQDQKAYTDLQEARAFGAYQSIREQAKDPKAPAIVKDIASRPFQYDKSNPWEDFNGYDAETVLKVYGVSRPDQMNVRQKEAKLEEIMREHEAARTAIEKKYGTTVTPFKTPDNAPKAGTQQSSSLFVSTFPAVTLGYSFQDRKGEIVNRTFDARAARVIGGSLILFEDAASAGKAYCEDGRLYNMKNGHPFDNLSMNDKKVVLGVLRKSGDLQAVRAAEKSISGQSSGIPLAFGAVGGNAMTFSSRFKHYPDEPLNPRIGNVTPCVDGNSLTLRMNVDGKERSIVVNNRNTVEAFNAGAVPLNVLANRSLEAAERQQQAVTGRIGMSSEEQLSQDPSQRKGIKL